VVRNGETRIAGSEVVRGDLIVLAEGDRIPADGIIVTAHVLMTDESLLTGESALRAPAAMTAVRP
jgi:P-type Ca2+ transporter type 2C